MGDDVVWSIANDLPRVASLEGLYAAPRRACIEAYLPPTRDVNGPETRRERADERIKSDEGICSPRLSAPPYHTLGRGTFVTLNK